MQRSDTGAAPSLLETLAGSRLDMLLLLGLWAILLWSGTQLPQADVPFAHTDGGTRADLLALRGLGLHRLAGSLPAWLLTATTIVVGLTRLIQPRTTRHSAVEPPASAADVAGAGPSAATDGAAGITADALAPRLQALDARFRTLDADRFRLGHAAAGRALLAVGAGLLLIGWLLHGLADPALIIETDANGAVAAHVAEAGRRGASGQVTGRCTPNGPGLTCALAGGGATGQPSLAKGKPASVGERVLTWVGSATPAVATRGRLRWLQAVDGRRAAWYGFSLPPGAAVEIAALHARAALVDGARAGPVVAMAVRSQAMLAAAPGLIRGAAAMRLDPPPRARLRFGAMVAPWWWLFGAGLSLLGLLLASVLPAAEVRLTARGAIVTSCNAAPLRRRIERALQAAAEGS